MSIKRIVTSFATILAASAFAAALPEGYRQLEFVQSAGNAYIDLDYIPSATDRLEVDISLPQTLNDNVQGILCSRDDGNTSNTRIMLTVSKHDQVGKGAFQCFYSTQDLYPIYYPEDNERVVIAIDGMSSKVFANGVFRGHLTAGSTFTPTTKLRLFALKKGTGVTCYTAMKLYGFKAIAANGSVRSECVPCINAEGVRGVYDFAAEDGAGKFFASANGNGFMGPLLRLPNDYEELEYIESSSTDNAYMNLELVPNATDKIESKFAVTKTDLSVQGLYCARASSSVDDQYPQIMMVMYGDQVSAFSGRVGKASPFKWKVNEPHLITLDLNTLKFAVDEKEVDLDKLTATPTAPLRLFALWSGSAPSVCCAARLYTFTWWTREGNLREKLVPARKKNGQVVGLYDLVQCRFFTNANTSGSFIAGPIVSNKWLVEPSLSKVTWATNERPGEIRLGLAKCGEVSCSCTADELLALSVGSHDVVFSVAAGEGYGALQKTVSVTVTAPFVPTVDAGDVTAKVVRDAAGRIAAAKLAFPQADVERDCVVVWDRCDKGASVANWANRQTVAKIPAGAMAATIDLPEPLERGGFRVYLSVLPTPSDYVSSGLVALYDAAYNAGPCEHTDLLGSWVNLADRTGLTDVPLLFGDIVTKGSIVLDKTVHKSKSEIFAAGDKVLTIEMNARPGDDGLETFGAVVGVPGVGTLGWSGSGRDGSVVFRQVLDQWYFPTYKMTDYQNFSDLLGTYLTYSVVRNDATVTPFINSEQMTRTSAIARTVPIEDSFLGVALGNAAPGVKADLRSVRIYNRELTAAELSANRRIDAARFDGLPLETAVVSDYITSRGLLIVVK